MNVLYITVDALRADHLDENVMPTAHSFADTATKFTNCVANGPGTPWSFPALLSSRYSGSTEGFGIPGLDDPHPTLAEILYESGYDTAGFTDNRFASSAYHYDRGMEEMFDTGATSSLKGAKQFVRENLDREGVLFQSLLRAYHIFDDLFVNVSERDSRFVRAEVLIDELLDWTADTDGDWFAWLHPMDVHAPYEAPEEYQLQYLEEPVDRVRSQNLARKAVHHPHELTDAEWELQRQLYKAECRYFDDQFSRLLSSLTERGNREETLIVFTADHGDMHGENGRGGHPQEFWEEVIRVPLAIDIPDDAPQTVDEQVALVDLPPTILDAVGIDIPPEWDGESRLPLVRREGECREYAYIDVGAELDRNHAGVRRADGWKLLRHREDGEFLFDLSQNPNENVADNRTGESDTPYDELSSALDAHLDEMGRRRAGEQSGVQDEEMIEDHLKELGYLE